MIVKDFPHLSEYLDDIMILARGLRSVQAGKTPSWISTTCWSCSIGCSGTTKTARQVIASKYSYIMVDEYQDTNLLQADIVYQLGKDHKNVMVVGDDAPVHLLVSRGHLSKHHAVPRTVSGKPASFRLEEKLPQPPAHFESDQFSSLPRAAEKYDKKSFHPAGGR